MLMVIIASVFALLLLTTGFTLLNISKKEDSDIFSFTNQQLGITNIIWSVLMGALIILRINESMMHSGFFLVSLKASIAIIIVPLLYLYIRSKLNEETICLKRYLLNLISPMLLLLLWVIFIVISKTTQAFQWGSFNYIYYWRALEYSYIMILILQIGIYTVLLSVNYVSLNVSEKRERWIPAFKYLLLGLPAGGLWIFSLLNHQITIVLASYAYLIFYVFLLFYLEKKGEVSQDEEQGLTSSNIAGGGDINKEKDPEAETESMRLIISRVDELLFRDKIYKNPNITLSSFARMIPTNETYLREAIKRNYKCSYSDLLNECRLTEVEIMLLEKEAQVNEVYEEVGFNSSSAFYVAFKRKHNITPTQWIQQHKQ